jgi:hypothetical protein
MSIPVTAGANASTFGAARRVLGSGCAFDRREDGRRATT